MHLHSNCLNRSVRELPERYALYFFVKKFGLYYKLVYICNVKLKYQRYG